MSNHPDKGKDGGRCNVTACQKPGAFYYNVNSRAYYCWTCACEINRWSAEGAPNFPVLEFDTVREGALFDRQRAARERYTRAMTPFATMAAAAGVDLPALVDSVMPRPKPRQPATEEDARRLQAAADRRARREAKRAKNLNR